MGLWEAVVLRYWSSHGRRICMNLFAEKVRRQLSLLAIVEDSVLVTVEVGDGQIDVSNGNVVHTVVPIDMFRCAK